MAQIKFGTDGWRAVIARDFTFDNLTLVSRATARWLLDTRGPSPVVAMGHDTRFQGRAFTEHVACVMAAEGVRVIFAETFTTTPAISWATKEYGCDAGIVITASHNPPAYNGFKIKAYFGGPASPDMIAEVEQRLGSVDGEIDLKSFAHYEDAGMIEQRDITQGYLDIIRQRIDIAAIKEADLKIAHDAMYGAGQGLATQLLGTQRVVELHCERNPGFHGQAPEPIERNLGKLAETVVSKNCDAGLANDGDADRIGMFDENGRFVTSHELLALLVKYLHEERGLTGDIVKTFSTTHMLDKMGKAYGLNVDTTAIGFKYIATKMVEGDVLVGGEESGGLAVKGHVPERDGIYIGLLIVEMMVRRGKRLSELVQELTDEFGGHHTYRVDVHTTDEKKQRVLNRLGNEGGLDTIAGFAVLRLDTLDGYKHVTDGGWLLVRPSGTEPVLRIYSEAETAEDAEAIVEDAITQLGV